jgi:transcriptional regulator with XRE-family HTH domain
MLIFAIHYVTFFWQKNWVFNYATTNAKNSAFTRHTDLPMNEHDKTRAKILGVLIKDARIYAGRSVAECAGILQISPAEMTQVERGEIVLSLPHLELLALKLKVPLSHFWGTQTISQSHQNGYDGLVNTRQQAIGSQLQQARTQAGRTQAEVADVVNVSETDVNAFENGVQAIPLLALERMGKYLGVSLDHFMDHQHELLSSHENEQKTLKNFQNLPPNMRAFVTEPVNRSYLETAMRMSEMDVNKLRQIAESILDITF